LLKIASGAYHEPEREHAGGLAGFHAQLRDHPPQRRGYLEQLGFHRTVTAVATPLNAQQLKRQQRLAAGFQCGRYVARCGVRVGGMFVGEVNLPDGADALSRRQ
jgi:hypothetical protein